MCAPDVDLAHAVENVVDGAYFNSGQCCCGIERVYVHADVYDDFVDGFADLTRTYVLGDPLDQATTLGPMAQPALRRDSCASRSPRRSRKGAKALIDTKAFARDKDGSPYVAPQVLAERRPFHDGDDGRDLRPRRRHHEGEGRRGSDPADERLALRADGLDLDEAMIGRRRAHRRADRDRHGVHEPLRLSRSGLAWTGVKDTGRGATLSRRRLRALTRPKSYHLRRRSDGPARQLELPRPPCSFGAGRIGELADHVQGGRHDEPAVRHRSDGRQACR